MKWFCVLLTYCLTWENKKRPQKTQCSTSGSVAPGCRGDPKAPSPKGGPRSAAADWEQFAAPWLSKTQRAVLWPSLIPSHSLPCNQPTCLTQPSSFLAGSEPFCNPQFARILPCALLHGTYATLLAPAPVSFPVKLWPSCWCWHTWKQVTV